MITFFSTCVGRKILIGWVSIKSISVNAESFGSLLSFHISANCRQHDIFHRFLLVYYHKLFHFYEGCSESRDFYLFPTSSNTESTLTLSNINRGSLFFHIVMNIGYTFLLLPLKIALHTICVHIHCLVSLNVQQASMNVNGCNFFLHKEI